MELDELRYMDACHGCASDELPRNVTPYGQLRDWKHVREFLYAGNAVFTLRSLKTGNRFTYQVRVKKQDVTDGIADPAYFVCWLRGADNTKDFAYMGTLRLDMGLRLTPASKATREALCVRSFVWFLDALKNERSTTLGRTLEVWHEGHCGRCGRRLTVPESIAGGFGPECAGRLAA